MFDWILSEFVVSVAQQKPRSQINQCLFVALRGGGGCCWACFGFGFYLDGSCKEYKALQSLIVLSFFSFAMKHCSVVVPDLVQHRWTHTIIGSNLASLLLK